MTTRRPTRKRAPENDYVCERCSLPCDPQGERHLGGIGTGKPACRRPRPILRAVYEARVQKARIARTMEAAAENDWPIASTQKED